MKKFAIVLTAALTAAVMLAGCGKNMDRENYNYDMSKYVVLDSYAVEVDSSSESYIGYYDTKLLELLVEKKTEGTVSDGDVANINYVGKKDGVAFEGGTASGYDLEIGSDSFIEGFEDGLIGVEIGSTVDLDLTFPENYDNSELAGQAVVFTVKVNYVTVQHEELNDDTAKACGYSSAAQPAEIAGAYALECAAWDAVYDKTVIEKYPEKEFEIFYDEQLNSYERMAEANSMTLETLASYYGMTEEELKTYIEENFAPRMSHAYALAYYIIDTEGVKVTDEQVDAMFDEMSESADASIDTLGISMNYVEAEAVREMALDIIVQNATLK